MGGLPARTGAPRFGAGGPLVSSQRQTAEPTLYGIVPGTVDPILTFECVPLVEVVVTGGAGGGGGFWAPRPRSTTSWPPDVRTLYELVKQDEDEGPFSISRRDRANSSAKPHSPHPA